MYRFIGKIMDDKKRVLVIGGRGSGKTALIEALEHSKDLAKHLDISIEEASDRIVAALTSFEVDDSIDVSKILEIEKLARKQLVAPFVPPKTRKQRRAEKRRKLF